MQEGVQERLQLLWLEEVVEEVVVAADTFHIS
jgi:hypothetical protein